MKEAKASTQRYLIWKGLEQARVTSQHWQNKKEKTLEIQTSERKIKQQSRMHLDGERSGRRRKGGLRRELKAEQELPDTRRDPAGLQSCGCFAGESRRDGRSPGWDNPEVREHML